MKKIIAMLLALCLCAGLCACKEEQPIATETVDVEPKLSPLLLRVFSTQETDQRTYIYNDDNLLVMEIRQEPWATTEYYYSDEGVLEYHKRVSNYDPDRNEVTFYETTYYDTNGSPIKIEGVNGVWEYDYTYAEDGAITSIVAQYDPVYGETITAEFDLSAEAEQYYCNYHSLSGSLALKVMREGNRLYRYTFLEDGSQIKLYEVGVDELDAYGNPTIKIDHFALLREDGGWSEEWKCENNYDDAGNLLSCTLDNGEQRIERLFMYGYYTE